MPADPDEPALCAGGVEALGTVDPPLYRRVMARFGTGVTVMTSMDATGEVTGMTANAITSVSLDPVLVLVCVETSTDMAVRVQSGRRFALSMLTSGQQPLADHFADPSRSRGWQGFADVPVTTATTGVPILADTLAWLDCVVHAIHPGGDHLIVVGAVVDADLGNLGPALGWFNHGYVTIPPS